MRLITISLSVSFTWLLMAISTMAQNPVLDTDGQALRSGVEYYVLPLAADRGGGLIPVSRNGSSCPYVGQQPFSRGLNVTVTDERGVPVIFTPFESGESVIREGRDLTVEFSAVSTTCPERLHWRVGEEDPETSRRLIATGGEESYFRIDNDGGVYNIAWCPGESCPDCGRPRCGVVNTLSENQTILLALDAEEGFPFVFTRVA